ncbi:MAG: alginate export family protein [Pseudomonadota bacterium]
MPTRLTALALSALTLLCAPSVAQAAEREDWRFGIEVRERALYFNNVAFDGDATEDDWLWTQRLAVSTGGWLAPSVKARLSVQSAVTSGAQRSPVDSNILDFREAYLDFGSDTRFVRLGRQELLLGSQRLIGTRDGTNVRRGWDGVRASSPLGDWQLDVLAVTLVEVEPEGVFNDRGDEGRRVGGIYASGPTLAGNVDLYLLYTDTDERATIEGIANQKRYSAGVRSFGERGQVFWNWEAIYQWGQHGGLDISAWTLATNTGYRFEAAWSPELMLSANIASGDGRSGDGKLGTFDALYPRGNYFSDAAILGPANFYNFNPYLTVSPSDRLSLSLDVNWFWRLETADGVYGAPGNVLRAAAGSQSDFVATGASIGARYQINDRVSAELIYAHNSPGDFIAETGPADTADFLELTLRFTL